MEYSHCLRKQKYKNKKYRHKKDAGDIARTQKATELYATGSNVYLIEYIFLNIFKKY
jgi:hypothetical protein